MCCAVIPLGARRTTESLSLRGFRDTQYPLVRGHQSSRIGRNGFATIFFRRLSEGPSGTAGLKGNGPPILWVQLANAAGNHNGLVNALTGQLAETAGLQRATLARMPDLADLLEAKSRLSRKQQETPLQSVRED